MWSFTRGYMTNLMRFNVPVYPFLKIHIYIVSLQNDSQFWKSQIWAGKKLTEPKEAVVLFFFWCLGVTWMIFFNERWWTSESDLRIFDSKDSLLTCIYKLWVSNTGYKFFTKHDSRLLFDTFKKLLNTHGSSCEANSRCFLFFSCRFGKIRSD